MRRRSIFHDRPKHLRLAWWQRPLSWRAIAGIGFLLLALGGAVGASLVQLVAR